MCFTMSIRVSMANLNGSSQPKPNRKNIVCRGHLGQLSTSVSGLRRVSLSKIGQSKANFRNFFLIDYGIKKGLATKSGSCHIGIILPMCILFNFI